MAPAHTARAAAAPQGVPAAAAESVGAGDPSRGPGGGGPDGYRLCSGILRWGPGVGNRGSVPSPARPGKLCWKLP